VDFSFVWCRPLGRGTQTALQVDITVDTEQSCVNKISGRPIVISILITNGNIDLALLTNVFHLLAIELNDGREIQIVPVSHLTTRET